MIERFVILKENDFKKIVEQWYRNTDVIPNSWLYIQCEY